MTVYQVRWCPGSVEFLGICHCGAEHVTDDPIAVWDCLLAHPDGHTAPAGRPEPAEPVGALAPA